MFNALARSWSGYSLNNVLHKGPALQANIIDVLMRWRMHEFVFTADIEKMYRQISICAEHRKFQRILWRDSLDDPVSIYDLNTVTYGVMLVLSYC